MCKVPEGYTETLAPSDTDIELVEIMLSYVKTAEKRLNLSHEDAYKSLLQRVHSQLFGLYRFTQGYMSHPTLDFDTEEKLDKLNILHMKMSMKFRDAVLVNMWETLQNSLELKNER